jgi:uncharacterized protein involved in exopolysaccharide biosynthesis
MEQHEPELIDYLAVLWRWRWLVMIGTLAGVLVAGIVTWSRPPTYRVVATIEGGDVAEQEVERLVTRLNLGSFRDVQEGTGPAPRVVGEYRRPLVIQLSLDTDSPAAAARILERTAGRAIDELTRLLSIQQEKDEAELGTIRSEVARQESIRRVRERRAEALRRSVERLQKARVDASGRVSDAGTALVFIRLSDDIDAKELMLAEVERELTTDIPRKLEDLSRQGEAVTRRMAAVRRPRLAVVPEGSQPPIRPRPKLNLAIGLTGGLLGSMLLALFLEYVRASRRRLTQAAS